MRKRRVYSSGSERGTKKVLVQVSNSPNNGPILLLPSVFFCSCPAASNMFKSDGSRSLCRHLKAMQNQDERDKIPLPLPLPPSTEEFNDNQITKEPEIDDSDAVAQPVDPLPELDQPQQPQTQPTQKIHFPQTQSAFKVSTISNTPVFSKSLLESFGLPVPTIKKEKRFTPSVTSSAFIISQKSPNRFSKPASPFKTAAKLKSDATGSDSPLQSQINASPVPKPPKFKLNTPRANDNAFSDDHPTSSRKITASSFSLSQLSSSYKKRKNDSDSGRKSLGANAFVIPSASKGGGWDIDEFEHDGFENGDVLLSASQELEGQDQTEEWVDITDDGGVEFMRIVTEGLVS
ncbi:hypothetical protein BCR33DRAFT_854575 [Rhizoclosmatium globosum]|uniref:SWIM-type domain-containing protein n=1 Tax=Rhizoclosmatium globosum TaxID=329046 RepID=A0A1Y2BSZ7_9FUNG|nr:hypothetical protein BCR33DRAFT_854575 [Rhizoclosmatium globosum]|eukprot:ORY37824.1 hypothetical protein BCR33DRAFT_854575 [Rhizoclosmatium globosum]